jgi:hypothetical protein
MFGGSQYRSSDGLSPHLWGLERETSTFDEVVASLDPEELAAVERFLERLERQGCISHVGASFWRSRLALCRMAVPES